MFQRLGQAAIIGALMLAASGSAVALFQGNGCFAPFGEWDGTPTSDPVLSCPGDCAPAPGTCAQKKRTSVGGVTRIECRCGNALGQGGECNLLLKQKRGQADWTPRCLDTDCDGECMPTKTGPAPTPPVFFYACLCVV